MLKNQNGPELFDVTNFQCNTLWPHQGFTTVHQENMLCWLLTGTLLENTFIKEVLDHLLFKEVLDHLLFKEDLR